MREHQLQRQFTAAFTLYPVQVWTRWHWEAASS